MPLQSGAKFGSFTIASKLGEGGMGEVYRATDTRLGRDVAIKVLPEAFAQDADRLARFEREAKALAALNHPNIAGIHGFEERATDAGTTVRALVMEFVDGDDLSALIARGDGTPGRPRGLSIDDVLPIARQIAAALEAAHEQGIVHRDLKPANVKVRTDGTVKVLDFGLAKALTQDSAAGTQDSQNSPTLTARATQMGMILGTAAYMAPEQARGKPVDRRADVWAYGAVLFEMLTGARAFPGEDITDTLAAVVRAEPNWSLLPPGLPSSLVTCLKRCLEKDPKQRIPDVATMRLALEGAFETSAPAVSERADRALSVPRSPLRSPLIWTLAVVALTSLGVAAFALMNRPAASGGSSARLTIALPPGAEITSYPAISRDGRTVAYVAQQGSEAPQLYLRDVDAFDARVVAGSSGARQPFFSPDGAWVGFFAQGQLLKAEVKGGSPIKITDAAYPFGATWMEDHTIIYGASLGSGLLQVPASGGAVARQLTTPDGAANGYAHVFPQALPGGRSLLFTIWGKERGSAVLSLDSGTWQMVLPLAAFSPAAYDASSGVPGRLLSLDAAANIRTAPFDPSHPAPTSAEATVLGNVYSDIETESMGWLAVSETGTAVFAAGNPAKASLIWLDPDGALVPVSRKQDLYREVSISPDGSKAVVRLGLDLWVHDLASGTSTPLTARANSNILPVWTRDLQRIVYASNRAGDWDIYSQPVNGSKPAEVLLKRSSDQFPYAIAPDGTLLYTEISATGGRDLWTLSPDGKSSPLRVTPANEYAAQFSPESGGPHWIAYSSDESGRPEIYVQSYPGGERRTAVSTGGGVRPMWSSDGRELYFVTGEAMVVTTMQPDGTFGVPRKLADRANFHINDRFNSFSVAPGAKRLLMIHRDEGFAPRQLNVILNWNR